MDSRSKRILLLNYEFPPLGGGASTASYLIARTLVEKGHQVDVVTSRLRGQAAFEECDGIRIHRVWCTGRELQDCGIIGAATYVLSAVPKCIQLIRAHRYDVVHFFFGLPTGALLLLVPGLSRIPSVISLRGSDVPDYDRTARQLPIVHWIMHPVTRFIWRQGGRVVANSCGLRALAHRFMPDREIGVIPNAVQWSEVERRCPHEALSRPVRLLCVARLVPRKGIDDLLEAVAQLGPIPLRLEIHGSGSHHQKLEQRMHALGLADRVAFVGVSPREELPQTYAAADVFVLPSHSESCSMALLEAMASGLPVIVTRVGGNAELVEDGIGGYLVPKQSPTELADALRRLIAAPALRTQMGDYNRKIARDRHSWESVVVAYLQEYDRAIEVTRARAS